MGFGKRVAFDKAADLSGFEWALIYRSEKIELISWDKADKEKIFCEISYMEDENLEVRAFSREKELHIFLTEDGPAAVYTEFDISKNTVEASVDDHSGSDAVEYMEEKYKLDKRFQVNCGDDKKKNTLIVRKLLAYDEDGQAYVRQTCLAGLEG